MGRRSLLTRVRNDLDFGESHSKWLIKETRERAANGDLVWVLVYDFRNARDKQAARSRFYRNLEKFGEGMRWTDSELVFQDPESAIIVRELASTCKAFPRLYGAVEI